MPTGRSVVMTVMVSLATTALVAIHAEDVTTLEYDDILPATETNARQRIDTDAPSGEHRQGRMPLHAELPSSKAKREQALRNILAARRRQILGQRSEITGALPARAARPVEGPMFDSSDVLEAQETRQGLYVTAPNSRVEIATENDASDTSTVTIERDLESNEPANPDTGQSVDNGSNPTTLTSHSKRNSSTSASSPGVTGQKATEADGRKKNTVSMPESLYNHFRPVETNIPVEDMSQFLYFGQKLHPEIHNTTGNNSVEVTPTSPTAPSSRRRYSMKRFGVTTAGPVPRLEEIINEEMNIAVERRTVEKNKVSKIKNTFRSPGNGLYFRKSRPSDSTIATNLIVAREVAGNISATGSANGTVVGDDDFRGANPSAHAAAGERGSPTHGLDETRNANGATQIPVSAKAREESEIRTPTSAEKESCCPQHESSRANFNADTAGKSVGVDASRGGFEADTPERTTGLSFADIQADASRRNFEADTSRRSFAMGISAKETRPDAVESNLQKDATRTTFEKNAPRQTIETQSSGVLRKSKKAHSIDDEIETRAENSETSSNATKKDDVGTTIPRDSNMVETSTSREKTLRPGDWTASTSHAETSTLRIVVTEGDSFATDSTVKTETPVASAAAPPPRTTPATTTARAQKARERSQHQQQHVYAYTITNVTRLLRNYTGPGSSAEVQGTGGRRGTGAEEITSGPASVAAAHRRRTLPRGGVGVRVDGSGADSNSGTSGGGTSGGGRNSGASGGGTDSGAHSGVGGAVGVGRVDGVGVVVGVAGSGGVGGDSGGAHGAAAGGSGADSARPIETTRAPAGLSAGATVEPVAAGATADLVGERQRKQAAASHGQSQQRAPARATTSLPNVNKGRARSELTTRGTVRWSHARPEGAANDRRFLRKSASAVLNQRVGPGGDEDQPLAQGKRRRVTPEQRASAVHETTKGAIGDYKHSGDELARGRAEDVAPRLAGVSKVVEGGTRANDGGMDSSAEETRSLSAAAVDSVATMDAGENLAVTERAKMTIVGREGEPDCDKCNETDSANETSSAHGAYSTDSASGDGANRGSERPVATTTERADETVPTTAPSPVFPVTPKILVKTNGAAPRPAVETFTLGPAESASRVTTGVAGDLEPSEIQSIYRSGNASSTENTRNVTTVVKDPVNVDNVGSDESVTDVRNLGNVDSVTGANAISDSAVTDVTTEPVVGTTVELATNAGTDATNATTVRSVTGASTRRPSGERSPEVRGRNLSDKTKEKDDVLPIMELYNTSSIFNGSDAVKVESAPLPTNASPVLETNEEYSTPSAGNELRPTTREDSRATAPPKETMETIETKETNETKETSPASESTGRVPATSTKESGSTQTGAKRDRQEENREPFSGPANGTSGNRTRHRTTYHYPVPEYNGSVYPAEINRTFFEAGLISVGPRDMVNVSEVISKRHDGDAIASQETVAVVSYILATLVVFPIAVGVGLILRRLIIRNRKVLEESDTSSEISCRKDALNLENGDFKTSIEKAITKLPRIQHLCHEAEKPPPPPTQESRWEFPRDKLRLQTVLGQGNFGQVWKAEADDLTGHQGTTRLVAVKTVKEGASDREKEDLVRELEIMQQLGSHPNVVTLLGCCTEEEPHYLILEYVMYGKLLAYLRDHRTRQDFYNFSEDSAALTSRDLTVFGYCVARGMEYLASKKIIHRDLAARNVLVDHNKLCKIADFGMSRFANEDGEVIETRHGRNALPIRWMAPESLIYSLFTTKTDVWSFGILMWEIVTLGSTPYPDMTAREVMRNVQNGYRLERPSHCRSELFRVISRCWHADPDRRPEFQTLRRDLAQLLEDNMNGHYVDLESFASECTD